MRYAGRVRQHHFLHMKEHIIKHPRFTRTSVLLSLLLAWSGPAAAHPFEALHTDPIAPVILGVTGILFFAILGRFAARKLDQPSVLGELIMGVVLGNLAYFVGIDLITVLREGPAIFELAKQAIAGESLEVAAFQTLGSDTAAHVLWILQGPHGGQILQIAQTVDVFSRYGVIFMLFLVGLDTSVVEMRRVGPDATRVALIGVVMPFALGFAAAYVLMPDLSLNTDLFIAATLGATSVGITARVLKDLNREQSSEAHIILGAAVMDDMLGLLMLSIVSGIIVSGEVRLLNVAVIIVLAVLFIGGVLFLGPYLLRFTIRLLCRLDVVEAKMFTSYLFVMILAWLANLVGLATIIGAFTAGLILNDTFFRHCRIPREEYNVSIKSLIMPLEVILVPIFFVLMGIQVKLETFFDTQVLVMAGGLLVAAIAGKLACGFGVRQNANRLAIGLGMMPRGEVGLIFAAIGKSLGVINDALFSAVVLTVIVTTLLSPPLLKLSLRGKPD
jgi:Kef-type K+ transport system membrane component KefB